MRILDSKPDIDYKSTKAFFDRRAGKYNEANPYSVTMYQDDNAELVRQRNQFEIEKLRAHLELGADARVLDLACGIGRWADAISDSVGSYLGIDFSEELVNIAVQRNQKSNVTFKTGSALQLDSVLRGEQRFNRILIIGLLMYLNDADIASAAESLEKHCEGKTIICIREPVAIESRLTLKDYYSSELRDNYNAIYRTRDELIDLLRRALLDRGFSVTKEGFLFDEDRTLNNRKETAQYYFILRRS